MPFIGNKPSAVPLTSADIADGIITSAKIVDGTIANADINSSAAITYSKLSLGTSIVNADISASAAIASTKLSGVNDAKAWVNFNGTGTVAIRASFNVSSITDLGTGNYTVNFTTAMSDANYAFSVDSREDEGGALAWAALHTATRVAQTTTTFRILFEDYNGGSSFDASALCLVIFR